MGFFEKLDAAQGLGLLCGVTVTVGPRPEGGPQQFSVRTSTGTRAAKPAEYVLLALHYYGHILARYPKTESGGYAKASDLGWWVGRIIEEGIWPGSDLVRDAGRSEEMAVLAVDSGLKGADVHIALIRSRLAGDIDSVVELPPGLSEQELMLSVVALLQGLTVVLGDDGIQLLDGALRRLRFYHDEGADYAAATAARTLANRAFREAGGDAA